MPDYKEVNRKRDMAESLIQSVRDMDLGLMESKHFSIAAAVQNTTLEAIHFVWAENTLYLTVPELGTHLKEYPEGWLVGLLTYVVDSWVATGNVEHAKALQDYGLL